MFSDTIDFSRIEEEGYPLIRYHGMICGNRTAALVAANGTIDWACLPRFDSDPVFASLLDSRRGGHFSIRPADTSELKVYQNYKEMTNILHTEFIRNGKTILRLTDFIPASEYATINFPEIHRYVEAPETDIRVDVEFKPIFNYARTKPEIEKTTSGYIFKADSRSAAIVGDSPLYLKDDTVVGSFMLKRYASKWLILLMDVKNLAKITDYKSYERLEETSNYWRNWLSQCNYHGVYSQQVSRSALALKGLFYEPTGLMVAAPTSSLPEAIGGERNFDYRYAWVRDTAYVVEALSMIGLKKEATKFLYDMMESITKSNNQLHTIYTIDGSTSLKEKTIDFDGYMHSKPVRVGNKASGQLQIDEYGSIINAIYYLARIGGIVNSYLWNFVVDFLKTLEKLWKEPDSSIWEFRTEPRHYVYSKLICWAAFDRAVMMGKMLKMSGPFDAWREIANQIKKAILDNGVDPTGTYLTQYFGSDQVDGALLRLPFLGFLPASDPLVEGTIEKIEEDLMYDGFLFKRYLNDDGFRVPDNAFLLLSFWYVEDLVLLGKTRKAREAFESLLQRGNSLNLFSEEIDLKTGQMLGNFPQALSHIGVVRVATRLNEAYKQKLNASSVKSNY
ncbi:MAG: glycoside hydrolase family 15 protein [Candidatus Thermoplasmatota archaeon]|nr:glycoside hydrolase family 15 protein [Candidatus Thermoplasmatota archaeon]